MCRFCSCNHRAADKLIHIVITSRNFTEQEKLRHGTGEKKERTNTHQESENVSDIHSNEVTVKAQTNQNPQANTNTLGEVETLQRN